tara:strand:- start:355 stop:624 length:270 start_codon:yes stop_codon:yes gene_type:complete
MGEISIKEISTNDLLKSIKKFGTVRGLKYTPTDMEDIEALGRDQIEKIYNSIMGGTKLTKKKPKNKKNTKVALKSSKDKKYKGHTSYKT